MNVGDVVTTEDGTKFEVTSVTQEEGADTFNVTLKKVE